jgi:hypothetical protein
MAKFKRITLDANAWDQALASCPDRVVFQTAAWHEFLAQTQKGELIRAALMEKDDILGYFSGFLVRKLGLKILGSPFPGWSTVYMGFNLRPDVPRRVALEALSDFAFKDLRCGYLEMVDSFLSPEDVKDLGFTVRMHPTLEIDLTQTEDAIFNGMDSVCRRNLRKAEKSGVIIEEARDEKFADEYSDQLKDVFAKQGLVPHYGADRVRALIKNLLPTGMLLLLRAKDPEGRCIATGIYPACHQTAYYWGGASWRQFQGLRPNELLHWTAMRHWKSRGVRIYNLVGNMDFKKKFGGRETSAPAVGKARNSVIAFSREVAPRAVRAVSRIAWKLKSLRGKSGVPAAIDE